MKAENRKHKILVVEDDADIAFLLRASLASAGYEVDVAHDGELGLEKVVSCGGDRPDLIMLDVVLPKMDGYAVARRIRENSAYSSIPIIMLTGKKQPLDKVTGLIGCEVDAYLAKPVDIEELLVRIMQLLSKKK